MFQELIEAFLGLVKAVVLAQMRERYPNIDARSSSEARAGKAEVQSRSERGKPRDWVAFSFDAWNFWDLHLGVIFDRESKRISLGVHISDKAWLTLRERIEEVPWETYSQLNPRYIFKEELGEHRFEEEEINLDISAVGMMLQELVNKTILYYEAVNEGIS